MFGFFCHPQVKVDYDLIKLFNFANKLPKTVMAFNMIKYLKILFCHILNLL